MTMLQDKDHVQIMT